MKIVLLGPSSSGKTTLSNSFPKSYTVIHIDDVFDKLNAECKEMLKNEYITLSQEKSITTCINKKLAARVRGKENFIIDLVDAPSLRYELPIDTKVVLLYSSLEQMVSNFRKRKDRPLSIFYWFSDFYKVHTNIRQRPIDTVKLSNFITALETIKYEFKSKKELVSFAKLIFEQMGIKNNKTYYITPRSNEYDVILVTKNNTPTQQRDKLLNFLSNN